MEENKDITATEHPEKMIAQMRTGIVKFKYVKQSGEERIAYGTTREDLVPKYTNLQVANLIEASVNLHTQHAKVLQDPAAFMAVMVHDVEAYTPISKLFEDAVNVFVKKEKKEVAKNEEYVNYYDLEAQGWRKFRKDSLATVYE